MCLPIEISNTEVVDHIQIEKFIENLDNSLSDLELYEINIRKYTPEREKRQKTQSPTMKSNPIAETN